MSKIKNIVKAYTSSLPEEQDWYKERMSICSACKWNSKNADPKNMSFTSKGISALTGQDTCGACGCVVNRKAAVKAEICGLHLIDGESPKWLPLEAVSSEGVKVEVDDSNIVVSSTKDVITINLGSTSETIVEFTASFYSKLYFNNVSVTCGCTVPEAVKEEGKTTLKVKLTTVKFKEGLNVKNMFLNYIDKSNNLKPVKVEIIVNKTT